MAEIKLFYSWQSDLDPKTTRNVIQDAIKAAVKSLKNVVTVDADRDTKGELGSPNIETIIFDKIKQCDIFIADVSIVNKYSAVLEDGTEEVRYAPNPNVMEELGYAAAIVDWNNVICFINEDYGDEKLLPFDLRNHRVTGFSLKDKNRSDVVKELRNIISSHVMDLIENGPRPKNDNADHEIGYYDCSKKVIIQRLISINMKNHPLLDNYIKVKDEEIIKLVERIKTIKIKTENQQESNIDPEKISKYVNDLQPLAEKISSSDFASSFLAALKRIKVSEEDKKKIRDYVDKHFRITLEDVFFDLGNLHEGMTSLPGYGKSSEGTEEEILKEELINKLLIDIIDVETIEAYPKTFDGIKLFPLAIRNKSVNHDKNLAVTLEVRNCDTVIPDKDLIADELKDCLEGAVCELGLIKALLELSDNGDISDRRGRGRYTPSWTEPQRGLSGFYTSNPNEDDYEEEIEHFIESPVEGNERAYRIEVPSLRPNEKSWLGIIAVEDNGELVEVSYRIQSENTDGSIEGTLTEVSLHRPQV